MPSIEGGGVEKNLFLISNFLSDKFSDISLITASDDYKKSFKTLKIITPYFNLVKFGRKIKYLFCLYELLKIIIKKKKYCYFVFSSKSVLYFDFKII
jgi:hypothetical protein